MLCSLRNDPASETNWKTILALHEDVDFVWIQFVPIHGAVRVRMIPILEFTKMMEHGQHLGIASVITHALRNDTVAKGPKSTGAIYLAPDLSTASISPLRTDRHRLEILARFTTRDGVPIPECPRQKLIDLSNTLNSEFGLYALVGYEIEVVFFKPEDKSFASSNDHAPISNHSWSAATSDVRTLLPVIEDVVQCLSKTGIPIQQFHAESAPGQWEIVLPPKRPLEAVDNLIRAREAIKLVAADHGYCATLHPRPFSDHAGTGAHIHISVNSTDSEAAEKSFLSTANTPSAESFFAGVINHFRALMAFCLPLDVSYERVATGIWSGGEYVSWGSQNRETPLRRIAQNRFEVKLHCGTANPYTSLAALLAAGIDGLRKGFPLAAGDCQDVPSQMTEEQRMAMGICAMIPSSLEESLGCLSDDLELVETLGSAYVDPYVAVTRKWNDHLSSMSPVSRRNWLLRNY